MIHPSDLATICIGNESIAGHTKALSINFWFSQNQRCKHSFLHTKLIFIGDGVIHPLKTELALQPLSMSLTRDWPSLNRSKNVKDIFNFTISLTLRNNDHDNDNNHTSKAQLTITLEWLLSESLRQSSGDSPVLVPVMSTARGAAETARNAN